MTSILPIITMSDLQRNAKAALASIKDYAVIQSHGKDRAFVLHPELGRVLINSGMLEVLRKHQREGMKAEATLQQELQGLIGNVLRELSKK